jgi:sulfide:quinone oxidoreductase
LDAASTADFFLCITSLSYPGSKNARGRVLCFLETGHGQASQLVFDFAHLPQPPAPNYFYHYEKMLFNKVYWYIVP